MYGREQRVLVRHYLEQGLSKAEIARILGVSRRPVYYWIETGQLERELDNEAVRYMPRPPVQRKIDLFARSFWLALTEDPKLSATRLHDEIRAASYSGGYTQVKEFVRRVRPTPVIDPVVRFEDCTGLAGAGRFRGVPIAMGKRFALLVTRDCSGCSSTRDRRCRC